MEVIPNHFHLRVPIGTRSLVPGFQLHRFRSLDSERMHLTATQPHAPIAARRHARSRFNCPRAQAKRHDNVINSVCQSRKPGVLALVLSVNGRKSDLEEQVVAAPTCPVFQLEWLHFKHRAGSPFETECVRQRPWAQRTSSRRRWGPDSTPSRQPKDCRPGWRCWTHSSISPLTIPSSFWSI